MPRRLVLSVVLMVALASHVHAETRADRLVAECDRLAASDMDPNRPEGVRGVPTWSIDGKAALVACAAALKVSPDEPRLLFQGGRALLAIGEDGKARVAFRLAHRSGYLIATESLATMLRDGLGGPQERDTARDLLDDAAASGRPAAMLLLGRMVAQGIGGKQDADEARQLFEQAMQGLHRYAAAGSRTAMCLIGSMHENGEGVPRDRDQASRWYGKAGNDRC
jgi:hypothetical protein